MESQEGQFESKVNYLKNEAKNVANKAADALKTREGVDAHQEEGTVTKHIESLTTQLPSGAFLSFAMGAIGTSLLLHLAGKKEDAQFIGQWVPTVLLLGLYNKLVKLHGSE